MNNSKHQISIEIIRQALQAELPGIKAQSAMLPKGRSLILTGKNIKESAVLLLLFPINDELHFCLTKRNSKLKHHPGQISLPGGRCEKNEIDPFETALRETEEEIGVGRSQIQLLGKLTNLYISVSNFNIHPYIGWMYEKPKFIINQNEVEDLIILPLNSIFAEEHHAKTTVKTNSGKLEVPCYKIEGNVIWGATSMMIAELEAILKTHYFHREEH